MNAPTRATAMDIETSLAAHIAETTEHVSEQAREEFRRDVLTGLTSSPKSLPCKYFYDTRGSKLFEQICETPEYYVTRTELAILHEVCGKVARIVGPGADVLEPGSGAGEKIRTLLDALSRPRSFMPIDISKSAVYASAAELRRDYPSVKVFPIVADFTKPFDLPLEFTELNAPAAEPGAERHAKVIFFPGSTISNFSPNEAVPFLQGLRSILGQGDFLFIGVDRIKDKARLECAYDDAAGVTAAFNLNLLERISSELETDLEPQSFQHRAVYNQELSRIEMHLDSKKRQTIRLCGQMINFEPGESIHTENSYKYSSDSFEKLADSAGFRVLRTFSDQEELFSLYLCEVPG